MNKKILFWSIFAVLLMLIVPFTALSSGPTVFTNNVQEVIGEEIKEDASSETSFALETAYVASSISPIAPCPQIVCVIVLIIHNSLNNVFFHWEGLQDIIFRFYRDTLKCPWDDASTGGCGLCGGTSSPLLSRS